MKKYEENSYGLFQKYLTGDQVRVWGIYKNPVGTVIEMIDFEANPIQYKVRYIYEDTGVEYVEIFDGPDLTLVRKG